MQGATGVSGLDGIQGATGVQGSTGAVGIGVPAGGAAGTFLTKNSATDYDTTWTDSGAAISETFRLATLSLEVGVTQLIWDTIFVAIDNITVNRIAIYCTQGSSSGATRVGIYSQGSSDALLSQSDSKASLTTGINVFTLATPYALTRGSVYMVAVQSRANGAKICGQTATVNPNSPDHFARYDGNNGADPASGMSATITSSISTNRLYAILYRV